MVRVVELEDLPSIIRAYSECPTTQGLPIRISWIGDVGAVAEENWTVNSSGLINYGGKEGEGYRSHSGDSCQRHGPTSHASEGGLKGCKVLLMRTA